MPEYLAPGVFVEEISFRGKSIEGVGTSVAALVGPTRTGPLRGKPELLTSFADFVRIYGDAGDLTLGGNTALNHTAIAAKAFFDGGGSKLYVARTVNDVNSTDADSAGSSALFASASDTNDDVTFTSRFPGARGNYTLEVLWRDSENLLKYEAVANPEEGEEVFLVATGLTATIRAAGVPAAQLPAPRFPLNFRGIVRREGNNFVIVDNLCEVDAADSEEIVGENFRPTTDGAGPEGLLAVAGVSNSATTSVSFARVTVKAPASGALSEETPAVLLLNAETDLSAYTGGDHWDDLTTLRGTIDEDGTMFTVDGAGLNADVETEVEIPILALAAYRSNIASLTVQRRFDIEVHAGGANGEVVYSYGNISTSPAATNSLPNVLAASPDKRMDALTSPVACSFTATSQAEVMAALYDLFDDDALSPAPNTVEAPRYLIELENGSDGDMPVAVDYGGEVDEVNGSTGLAALEDIEDIAIAMTPAAAADENSHQAVVAELQKHCRKMRYRVGIVDSREGMSLSEIREFRSNFDDSRLALYYPWVVVSDPTGQRQTITVPPSGFIAGVYANTDVTRGVHKPPANEPVIGALRFAQDINRFQQEVLNPDGINCLRSFPGRGHRVWGGRTLSSDPEWKYVNVRRYFLYLERSIEKSTQWIVFEPNGERLWANVRQTVEDFLYNEWFNGRLLGSTPKSAYFVRCDRSTMTQNDLDNGRLVCEIGVAPLKPAEFVIFRIGQKTADA